MSHLNPPLRFRLIGALAGTFLFAAAVPAQTPQAWPGASNDFPRLTATLEPGETVGHQQVLRERLRSGTNEFLFVVPEGSRPETAPDGTPFLSRWEQRYHIAIRWLALPASTSELQQALRQRLTSQYPQASSPEAFETTAAGQRSCGLLLRVEQPGNGTRLIRVVWVPFPTGLLELCLNADANAVATSQQAFDQVLLTLRSNQRGPLHIIHRSDKS